MISKDANQLRPIILDIGSSSFRIGWAGDDEATLVVPSVYCDTSDYLFQSEVIEGLETLFSKSTTERENYLFGYKALEYQNILNIHEFRKEENYFIFQNFFNYYYNQLQIAPENQLRQPIIVLAPFYMTEVEKAKIQQILFDLNFPMINFISESQAILSTLQKASGVIVNMGESKTYISSFLHGFSNIMARDTFPIAGAELTEFFLNNLLTGKGAGKTLYIDNWLAKEIKEKSLVCVQDVHGEKKRIKDGVKDYDQLINFPDGSSLKIDYERFMVTEALFDPKLMHIDYVGLPEAIANVIKTWDRENWQELTSNIILTGGVTLIPGLKERIRSEILQHFSEKIAPSLKIIAVKGRENMAWIGASILHSRGHLDEGWIQNPNYVPPSHETPQEPIQDSQQDQI